MHFNREFAGGDDQPRTFVPLPVLYVVEETRDFEHALEVSGLK